MQNKTLSNLFKGDKVIWMIFFFLCIISVVEVYSASSSLSYKHGDFWGPIIKHTGLLVLGFFAMLAVLNTPCKYFRLATGPLWLFCVITLWVVLGMGKVNDGSRWLSIAGISFQPSELAKGALILSVAQVLSAMQTDKGVDKKALKYICWLTPWIVVPILLENLSTALIICTVIYLMMIIGGVPGKQLLKFTGGVLLAIALFVGLILLVGRDEKKDAPPEKPLSELTVEERKQRIEENKQREAEKGKLEKVLHRADTWKSRIVGFFGQHDVSAEEYDIAENSQEGHSKIAIAQANYFGKGVGNSTEREFLPQAFSDFIYAIVIEEMGVIGGAFVAFLYVWLLIRAGKIARQCENTFPALLAIGLALMLVTQAMFNMFVAVGLMPVTGQPLPLVSKGGTSSIINCIYLGVLLSISRTAKRSKRGEVVKAKATATNETDDLE